MQYAALDIGGSKIALCCVDVHNVSRESVVRVAADSIPSEVMADVVALLDRWVTESGGLRSLGIASAPNMDARGVVTRWPNRPQWEGTDVAGMLSRRFGCGVSWCDDGTAATAADAECLGVENLLHFSLGTGVGGGIVFEGRVLADRELGHLIVMPEGLSCTCGRRGCLQAYASASSLAREDCAPNSKEEEAWLSRAVTVIAICCANLVEVFRVDVISLSGGLIGRFPSLPTMVAEKLAAGSLKTSLALPRVVVSPYGTGAALRGALQLAKGNSRALANAHHGVAHPRGHAL